MRWHCRPSPNGCTSAFSGKDRLWGCQDCASVPPGSNGTHSADSLQIDPAGTCGDDLNASVGRFTLETSKDGRTFVLAAGGTFAPADAGHLTAVPLKAGTGTGVQYVRYTILGNQAAAGGGGTPVPSPPRHVCAVASVPSRLCRRVGLLCAVASVPSRQCRQASGQRSTASSRGWARSRVARWTVSSALSALRSSVIRSLPNQGPPRRVHDTS